MLWCWEYYGRDRPSFGSIIEYLEPDLSDAFVEKSFYFNQDMAESIGGTEGGLEDETCLNWEEDEDDEGMVDDGPATPLTQGTPQHHAAGAVVGSQPPGPQPMLAPESYSDTHSSLSYDSHHKPSPAATPNNNQNSFLLPHGKGGDGAGGGEGSTPPRRYPGGGLPNGPASAPPPLPPQKDPYVLKDTAHLWQRPPSPTTGRRNNPQGGGLAHNHSASSPNAEEGGERPSGDPYNNHVDNSRDGSKSSGTGGSGGRNGITNGHIAPHHVTPAQC